MNAILRVKVPTNNSVEWLSTIEDLIAMNCCLHNVSLSRTPLLHLVLYFLYDLEDGRGLQLPLFLNIWLECLRTCGVDLKEYGQTECDMFQEGLVDWYFTILGTWRISGFEYGSLPSDWSIEIEQLSDSSTDSPGDMPGGWIEDDQSVGETDVVDVEGLQQRQRVCVKQVSIRKGAK